MKLADAGGAHIRLFLYLSPLNLFFCKKYNFSKVPFLVNDFLGKVKHIVRKVGAKSTSEVVAFEAQRQHSALVIGFDPVPCRKIRIGVPVGLVSPNRSTGRPIQDKQYIPIVRTLWGFREGEAIFHLSRGLSTLG